MTRCSRPAVVSALPPLVAFSTPSGAGHPGIAVERHVRRPDTRANGACAVGDPRRAGRSVAANHRGVRAGLDRLELRLNLTASTPQLDAPVRPSVAAVAGRTPASTGPPTQKGTVTRPKRNSGSRAPGGRQPIYGHLARICGVSMEVPQNSSTKGVAQTPQCAVCSRRAGPIRECQRWYDNAQRQGHRVTHRNKTVRLGRPRGGTTAAP